MKGPPYLLLVSILMLWALARAAEIPETIATGPDGTKIIKRTPQTPNEELEERLKNPDAETKLRVRQAELSARKRPTVDRLVQKVREKLPGGWKADYFEPFAFIRVWREERALADQRGVSLPLSFSEVIQENIQVAYFLRVQRLIAPARYQVMAKEKAQIAAEIESRLEQLRAMQLIDKRNEFIPKTKEQKVAVAEYEALKKRDFDLPDFSFEDISLTWDGIYSFKNLNPENDLLDVECRAECRRVRQKIKELMKSYVPVR